MSDPAPDTPIRPSDHRKPLECVPWPQESAIDMLDGVRYSESMKLPEKLLEFFRKQGRIGGKLGGPARAASLTDKQRSESARKAVEARWARHREEAEQAVRKSKKFKLWLLQSPALSAVSEPHFSPKQLADLWGVSVETIRTIFRNEPGVLKIGKPGTRTRRQYFTLRIPQPVAERVHERLSA
jgi:hypothetical protein